MNAPPPLPVVALHARRCVRHITREAAARCPQCGEFFCRECVVEHAGRLLCAPCLAKISTAREARRTWLGSQRRGLQTAAGALVLWLVFYWAGALLLKLPPDFHDGTVWKRLGRSTAP